MKWIALLVLVSCGPAGSCGPDGGQADAGCWWCRPAEPRDPVCTTDVDGGCDDSALDEIH